MASDPATAVTSGVVISRIMSDDDGGLKSAIELGNRSRATLGHMPFAAYRDAADKGTLVGAYLDGEMIGYALYGLTRTRIRLTHLCVSEGNRRHGVAHELVQWISRSHPKYPGILAKCRDSYQIGNIWIRLGFAQLSQQPGRSRAGHLLTSWWLDHHQPNLFTRDDDSVLVRAAIDIHVLCQLADDSPGNPSDAHALIDDQVADRLELTRTASLDVQLNRLESGERALCTRRLQHLASPRSDPDRDSLEAVKIALTETLRSSDPEFQNSDDDLPFTLVTEAIAIGVHVLVTGDEKLIETFGPAARIHGLRILRPADVVVHMDELVRVEAYRPAALSGTKYRQRLIGVEDTDALGVLVDTAAEEPHGFLNYARSLAAKGCQRQGTYGPDGDLLAVVVTEVRDGVLHVPLIRVADTSLADTLASHLLFQLRQSARDASCAAIVLSDQHSSRAVRTAAFNDGFREGDNATRAVFTIDLCAPAHEIAEHAITIARQTGLPQPVQLNANLPTELAAELERTWWPAKFTDSQLQSYLIPIQQANSSELLGIPPSLLPRDDGLGLARAHVYYRSPNGLIMTAPARVLWYMSETEPRRRKSSAFAPASIVACSHLEAVITDSAENLFARFRHLGVWTLNEVKDAEKDGLVQALPFIDTEPLAPISRSRLSAIAKAHGAAGTPPQGPTRISPELFAALYREGRGH